MTNMFASFSNSSLTRAEMKKVVGGACYFNTPNGPMGTAGAKNAKASAAAYGTNWCCDSCSSASWCTGC